MKGLLTVFRKEVLENARDRRTLMSALIMGPLFGPILFAVIASVIGQQQHDKAEERLKLPVAGAQYAPNLIAYLHSEQVEIKPAPDDPEAALRRQDEAVILRISADYAARWDAGKPARVDLLYDGSRSSAQATVHRVRDLLHGYSRRVGVQRLIVRGLSPESITPLAVVERDQSSAEGRAALVLSMLPYFLILSTFLGGMYLAIDTTTGERERQSLEPLLITPVPREQILLGKLGATVFYALFSAAASVIAFCIVVRFIPFDAVGVDLQLKPAAALGIFLGLIPVALFAGTLQTLIASFAGSFREAQTYLQLLMFVPIVPSLWLAVSPVKTALWMTVVPILSQNLIITALVRGDAIPSLHLLLSVSGTLAFAVVVGRFTLRLYEREELGLPG